MATTSVAIMLVVALQLLFSTDGEAMTRQTVEDCNSNREWRTCMSYLNTALGLSQQANSADSMDQILGNLSTFCAPNCRNILRMYSICFLGLNVEGYISFFCGNGPGGEKCLIRASKNPGKDLFMDFFGSSSTCRFQSNSCSSTCGSALAAYVKHFGCCAGSFVAIGNFNTSNPPPLFAACNATVPGVCSTSDAAVLQVSSFTVLVAALLVTRLLLS